MVLQNELNRILTGVRDALAALAESGADVWEGARADDLAALIRTLPRPDVRQVHTPLRVESRQALLALLEEDPEPGTILLYEGEADGELVPGTLLRVGEDA